MQVHKNVLPVFIHNFGQIWAKIREILIVALQDIFMESEASCFEIFP